MGIKDRDGYTMSPCVQGMTAFVKDQEHEDLVVVNNHNISAQILQTAGEPGTKRWAISIPRTLNMKRADGITRRNFQPPAHDLSYCAAIARPLSILAGCTQPPILAVYDSDPTGDLARVYLFQYSHGQLITSPAHDLTDYWWSGGNLQSWLTFQLPSDKFVKQNGV